jgi:flagellar biosynthesis/type III secretory pathway ATPase
LAARNHYPAIDVLQSASRVMPEVTDDRHRASAAAVRELMAAYAQAEDLINIGAYQRGANPTIDRAMLHIGAITEMLRQGMTEDFPPGESLGRLHSIAEAE